MVRQDASTSRARADRSRATTRSDYEGVERQILGTPPPLPPTGGHVSGAESRSSGGMERFRNLLFVAGLDHGPVPRRALERALRLARANRAKLTFIDVVHEPELFREIRSLRGSAPRPQD